MATVKQDGIVFEYPDDVDIPDNEKAAVETDEVEIEEPAKKEKPEVKVSTKAGDIDLEIEDDTPPEDRNKEPLPKEIVDEIEKDTLDDYSDRVKTRLSQMKKGWHDERRAKEAAEREREEAIKYAKQIADENKKLKTTLSSGEEEYIKAVSTALENQLVLAKRDYREAYDAGDSEKIIEAQAKMNDAQMRLSQIQQYKPQYIYIFFRFL